jgi:hypothetical protein
MAAASDRAPWRSAVSSSTSSTRGGVIEENLAGTEFADYVRIYDERREPSA